MEWTGAGVSSPIVLGGDGDSLECIVGGRWAGESGVVMKTDGKTLFLLPFLYFLNGNGSGFEQFGFENRIGICGHAETDKYRWRFGQLNYDHII